MDSLMGILSLMKALLIDVWFAWIPLLLGIGFCDISAKPTAGI